MKRILVLFIVLLSYNVMAAYHNAKLFFFDGSTKSGMADTSLGDKYILFKSGKDSKVEEIDASKVSRIIYTIENKTFEYQQLKLYKGWKQAKIEGPAWLEVVEKGIVSLYVFRTTMSSANKLNSAGFQDYYCIRAGEPAAKWVSAVSSLNNNQHFKAKAPLYFADYPELAAKIKSKEYTWKDLLVVVREYNKWAAKKKK
jgi:hypothetical protein